MQNVIQHYLDICKSTDFPYPQYTNTELIKSFDKLCTVNVSKMSNLCLDIIKQFHKSIWRCNIYGHKPPIVAWQEQEIMAKVIRNRLKYLSTDNLTANNLLMGLSVTKLAPKVSIFRPALARYTISEYLNGFKTIFDPYAGFSGRLLGAASLNKKYIGQDSNSVTVNEAKQIVNFLELDAELFIKDSIYDTGEYKCLFTCPPYGNKENWCQDIEELSSDEWITQCLNNYKCRKYVFVVDKTEQYKKHIAEELSNKSHFNNTKEYIIVI